MQLGASMTGGGVAMCSSINALPKVSVSRTCFKESGFHLKTISFELHLKTISVEFRPKDAIAPIAPFVAMTMGDGRGCEVQEGGS